MLLWIVIAVVVVISMTSSTVMYYVMRRRRASLRRRVANGEVDLEALGIKQLPVPKDILDKMPMFIYVGNNESTRNSTVSIIENNNSEAASEVTEFPSLPSSPTELDHPKTPPSEEKSYTQSTCPICLDDFVSHTTIVRELQPCSHIYHPECIDSFLQKKSSLCPMCKTSVLPRGYCPRNISLTTVRREYMFRQQHDMRQGGVERVAVSDSGDDGRGRQGSRRRVGLMGLHDWVFGGRRARRENVQRRGTLPGPITGAGTGGIQFSRVVTTSTNPAATTITTTITQTTLNPSSQIPAPSNEIIDNEIVSPSTESNNDNNRINGETFGQREREIEHQGKWRRSCKPTLGLPTILLSF